MIITKHLPDGPKSQVPKRIIIHAMAEFIEDEDGTIYHAVEWLEKQGLSAHCLITPGGDIIRCRNDNEGAWHAKGFNEDSLGLEFLVQGTFTYFPFLKAIKSDWVLMPQYTSGLEQVREWYDLHEIERIDQHSDVDPKRKQDPGKGFRWEWFLSEI